MPENTQVGSQAGSVINVRDLYAEKGELITQLEIAQARLNQINAQIQTFMQGGMQFNQPK